MNTIEMYNEVEQGKSNSSTERLNRSKWFNPLISIVLTHFNYSELVKDALLSIIDQTYDNWECVVIDDASAPEHVSALERIVREIGADNIRLLKLPVNGGQITAFFAGLDATAGEFVCILDPDDRYDPTFLQEMLRAHLNETVLCPVAGCSQRPLKSDIVLGGTLTPHKLWHCTEVANDVRMVPLGGPDYLLYFPPNLQQGWLWPSTSSLMFRRTALRFMRPPAPLGYKRAVDSYLAQGAHLLGGALFLTKPLVYRGVHETNSWISQNIFATGQILAHDHAEHRYLQARSDVLAAIHHHGATKYLEANGALVPEPKAEPCIEPSVELLHVNAEPPDAEGSVIGLGTRKPILRRWRRSIEKQWRRVMALLA
jgi:glycosyltransferase involved in cell wall biosynthesis